MAERKRLGEAKIRSYIDQLVRSVGIRPLVNEGDLRRIYNSANGEALVRYIAATLKLRVAGLYLVNSGGSENAVAWVRDSHLVPLYGTTQFKDYKFDFFIRKSFIEDAPFEAIVSGIAHEMCHIVMYALRHPLCHEEPAVDLVAMILGYRSLFCRGYCYKIRVESLEQARRLGRRLSRMPAIGDTLESSLGYLYADELLLADQLMNTIFFKSRGSR